MRVLVCAEIEDGVVFLEDVLCAVTVMHIEIDDEYSLVADLLCIAGADCDIVEYAESHGPVRFRMVAGRTDGAESPLDIAALAPINRLDDRTGSVHGGLKGMSGQVGISIEETGEVLHSLQVFGGMNSEDILIGRLSWADMNDLVPAV